MIIEEPEAHLHPLAQDWLAAELHRFVGDGIQILITTHSPAFLRLLDLEGLVLVRKSEEEHSTEVTQLNVQQLVDHCQAHGGHVDEAGVLAYYEGSATPELKSGFFARAIVLVEGLTESLSLPVLFGRAGLEVAREGIAIIPVQGKGNLSKWWRLFTAYDIQCYVIFDNDTSDDGNRSRREAVLEALEVDPGITDDLCTTDEIIVMDRFAVMGGDYEKVMRASYYDYTDLEAQASEAIGDDSKPLKARWVAERLDLGDSGPVHDLARAIMDWTGLDSSSP